MGRPAGRAGPASSRRAYRAGGPGRAGFQSVGQAGRRRRVGSGRLQVGGSDLPAVRAGPTFMARRTRRRLIGTRARAAFRDRHGDKPTSDGDKTVTQTGNGCPEAFKFRGRATRQCPTGPPERRPRRKWDRPARARRRDRARPVPTEPGRRASARAPAAPSLST